MAVLEINNIYLVDVIMCGAIANLIEQNTVCVASTICAAKQCMIALQCMVAKTLHGLMNGIAGVWTILAVL